MEVVRFLGQSKFRCAPEMEEVANSMGVLCGDKIWKALCGETTKTFGSKGGNLNIYADS